MTTKGKTPEPRRTTTTPPAKRKRAAPAEPAASRHPPRPHVFVPLERIVRPFLTTPECSYYLNREQQTLRGWASTGEGPIQPIKVYGRLAWPVAEVRAILGVA